MKPIYEPKGASKEYGDYAINIYTGCPHKCFYCFAPRVLHREKDKFYSVIEPRKNIEVIGNIHDNSELLEVKL